jgi:hypothetical protein
MISTGPASDTLTALDKTVQEGCRSITHWWFLCRLLDRMDYQCHRFKAACAQRGVYDLNTWRR